MSDPNITFDDMIRGLRVGDERIAEVFWARYGQDLERLAGSRLPKNLRRRISPEDVVQSVCRTFLRRAGAGQFELNDSKNVWGLLCAITLTKVHEQSRFHLRKKRGASRESPDGIPTEEERSDFRAPVDPSPSPAEAAEFADQFRHLIDSFDEEERRIVELKLGGCTNDEVAEHLRCSERTVRRILKQLQARLGAELDAPTTHSAGDPDK